MELNTIRKCGLILSILLTTTAYANDKIVCPPIEKIQQASQQINNALLYDGTYRVTTSEFFQESSLFWAVGVRDIVASSSDEAIGIARNTASKINHKKHEYAEVWAGPINLYFCDYGPGDVVAVGTERVISQSKI